MMSDGPPRIGSVFGLLLSVALLLPMGCQPHEAMAPPARDINLVLAAHDRELLAIPGVVGVYVGLTDRRPAPCLRVMVAHKDAAMQSRIPKWLEGYPVVVEVTGPIKPMR